MQNSDIRTIKTRQINSLEWGVPAIDAATQGVPSHSLSVVETPNHHSGSALLGQFLHHGLLQNEKVALITFDTPTLFIENFLSWNYDFAKYLETEQFYLLNFSANISHEISLTHNYEALLSELKRLCGNAWPSRIAIQQIDTLVSLNSIFMMNACVQKLVLAANALEKTSATILGQFVNFHDSLHHDLSVTFQKIAPAYFKLSQSQQKTSNYEFHTLKLPWFEYEKQTIELELNEKQGFILGSNNAPLRPAKTGS